MGLVGYLISQLSWNVLCLLLFSTDDLALKCLAFHRLCCSSSLSRPALSRLLGPPEEFSVQASLSWVRWVPPEWMGTLSLLVYLSFPSPSPLHLEHKCSLIISPLTHVSPFFPTRPVWKSVCLWALVCGEVLIARSVPAQSLFCVQAHSLEESEKGNCQAD